MSERIDHAAKAREILHELDAGVAEVENNLPHDWCGASDNEQWMVSATFAEAQVHATLALVEQQRIANLIAYEAYSLPTVQQIRAGLGLS